MINRSLRRVVSRLWRGQYGLAKTWWLFGVVGTLLLNTISGPLNAFAATSPWEGIGEIALLIAVVIVAAVGIIYGVVVTFGLVRSAMAYDGNRVWSWLAITFTACAWIFTLVYILV